MNRREQRTLSLTVTNDRESAGSESALLHGTGAAAFAAPVLPLLHGAAGPWDDIAVFAALMLMVGIVTYMSWKSGRKKRRDKKRQSRGQK